MELRFNGTPFQLRCTCRGCRSRGHLRRALGTGHPAPEPGTAPSRCSAATSGTRTSGLRTRRRDCWTDEQLKTPGGSLRLAVHVGGLGLLLAVLVPHGEKALRLVVDEGALGLLLAVLVPQGEKALRLVVDEGDLGLLLAVLVPLGGEAVRLAVDPGGLDLLLAVLVPVGGEACCLPSSRRWPRTSSCRSRTTGCGGPASCRRRRWPQPSSGRSRTTRWRGRAACRRRRSPRLFFWPFSYHSVRRPCGLPSTEVRLDLLLAVLVPLGDEAIRPAVDEGGL